MTTIWGQRKPNDLMVRVDDLDGAPALIIGHTQPGDWVEFPPGHPLGGSRSRVGSVAYSKCPKCGSGAMHYTLEADRQHVAECSKDCGFVWYEYKRTAV